MAAINHTAENQLAKQEIVLKELLEETQQLTRHLQAQANQVEQLAASVEQFNGKLEKISITPPPVSTKPVEEIVQRGLTDIWLLLAQQPKQVVHKFQLLLFPEQDARLFYRIVFGRWLVLLAVMLFINNAYKWAVHWSDNRKQVQQYEVVNDRINKAWNYLYLQKGRGLRKAMDSAYVKANEKR